MIFITADNLEDTFKTIQKSTQSLDKRLAHKVVFICEEIITNMVTHADFGDTIPDISLDIKLKEDVELVFKDNAKEFNILKYPQPDITLDVDSRDLGGLGIYLIKEYAKTIKYSYENGYNILRIKV